VLRPAPGPPIGPDPHIDRRPGLSRRDLLKHLLATPAAAVVDWEQILWIPRPQIVVPTLKQIATLDEINAITLREVLPGIEDNMFRINPLLAYLQQTPRQRKILTGIEG